MKMKGFNKRIANVIFALVMTATGILIANPSSSGMSAVSAAENAITDSNVLSVKLQLRENEDETTDMRIVSSVDSLDYASVGFDIYFYADPESEPSYVPFKTGTVQKRIKVTEEGVAYDFSPKVIDGESQYFVSVTIKNIAKAKRECDFYIKPYWVTTDGVKEYGQSRYLSTADGLDAVNINIPVRMPQPDGTTIDVTVSNTPVTAEVAYYEEESGYAHLNVPVKNIVVGDKTINDRTKLLSATNIQISDSVNAVYRNYINTELETDTSWYDVDSSATEFVIAKEADLKGLASIVNGGTELFKDDTVILVSDVAVNEGTVAEGTSNWEKWTPIGKPEDGKRFAGTFDADNNTISGIYMTNSTISALFGGTETDSMIQNLRLTESYFSVSDRSTYQLGSVVADCHGSLANVYSDAVIHSAASNSGSDMNTGGLVATLNAWDYQNNCPGTISITNCWYEGSITSGDKTRFVGGITGNVTKGAVTISNCLFTGKIYDGNTSYSVDYVGGFFGDISESAYETTLNITSCISAGEIHETWDAIDPGSGVGAIGGYFSFASSDTTGTTNSVYLNLDTVYATRDCFAKAVTAGSSTHPLLDAEGNAITDEGGNAITAETVVTGAPIWTYNEDRFIGYCKEVIDESTGQAAGATTGAPLNFTEDWFVRTDGVPIPQTMEDVVTKSKVVKVTSKLDEEIALDTFGVELVDATNMGIGNYVHTIEDTTLEEYQAYLTALLEKGFEKYASNTDVSVEDGCAVDGVHNAVYVKETGNWVLSITYVENLTTLYINISTGGEDSLSPHLLYTENVADTDYKATGKITFVMSQITQGNQFIQRLPNGHFIIDDGGQPENLEALLTTLKEMAAEVDMDYVYVDAWHISHQHADHGGVFNTLNTLVKDGQQELLDGIYVEGIYMSEPNNIVHLIEGVDISALNQYLGMRWLRTSAGEQTPVYRYHTGQRYYFNGVIMDVIQSQEVIPLHETYLDVWSSEGQYNPTSSTLIYTMSSGEKIFISADATHLNSDYIMKAYGSVDEGETLSELLYVGKLNVTYDDVVTGTDKGVIKSSKMLSDINVFVAPHHGQNTTLPYANWLATEYGEEVDGSAKFDTILFPFIRFRMTGLASLASEAMYTSESQETQNYANQWLINNLIEGGSVTIDEDADTVTATGDVHHYGDGSVVLEYVNTGITAGAEDKEEPEWSLPF